MASVCSCPSAAACFLVLLVLVLVDVASSGAAPPPAAYETQYMDHGLAVMPLPPRETGPESLAFSLRGEGPYAGVSDGRVLRWRGRRLGWTVFAYNSRHKSLEICSPAKKLVPPEVMCGRPLGLQFHHKTGDLYIADAYLGLMRVGARGGLAEVLATEAGGVPFNFLNGLDVDQMTGYVYFTDSSTMYRRSEVQLMVALGDETGRLLRYDPRTRRVTVLHAGLPYPNGVAVSADGTRVVVAHTVLSELRQYWVRGPRAGENETLAELPGYPDNVRRRSGGHWWVALNSGPFEGAPGDAAPTVAVRIGPGGAVEEALTGFSFASVSEVHERNGTLWVGSVDTPYAAAIN